MQSDLTTKSDLRELELWMKADTEAAKTDTVKWVIGAIGFETIVMLGAVLALARLMVR